jgi:hypothetical protein
LIKKIKFEKNVDFIQDFFIESKIFLILSISKKIKKILFFLKHLNETFKNCTQNFFSEFFQKLKRLCILFLKSLSFLAMFQFFIDLFIKLKCLSKKFKTKNCSYLSLK